MKKIAVPAIAVLALVAAAAVFFSPSSSPSASAAPSPSALQGPGAAAPAFTVKTLDGRALGPADWKGKVLVVNFWATWCPPCREEIPDFVEFYEGNRSRGLEIVGLSVDRISSDQLQQFVDKFKVPYPIGFADVTTVKAFDPGDFIPTTFIIDRKGVIRHKHVGGLDKATLTDWFKRLSAE